MSIKYIYISFNPLITNFEDIFERVKENASECIKDGVLKKEETFHLTNVFTISFFEKVAVFERSIREVKV